MSSTSLAPSLEEARPDPAGPRPPYLFVAALGLLGAALLTVGTVLHPAHADAGSPAATSANGLALTLGGFSGTAMVATTVSGPLGLLLLLLAAVWSRRRAVIQHP